MRKEFIHISRDPRSLLILFLMPLLLMFIFGYAINMDLKHIRIGVCDLSRTPSSRELIETLNASTYFNIVARYDDPRLTEDMFKRRLIRGAVIIPHDFDRSAVRDPVVKIGVIADGTDANSTTLVQNYLEGLLMSRSLAASMDGNNMLRVIFVVPILQLMVLGYAITTDVKNLDLLIVDQDRSSISRNLTERFSHTEYFNVSEAPHTPENVENYLFRGEAVLALVIPRAFGRDIETGEKPELQILLDGQNSNASAVALGYCNRILLEFMQDNLARRIARNPHLNRSLRFIMPVSRIWYNPELKSVYYMIPGIISILLTIITMLLTSLAIVKEREIGTLDQLMVTPLTAWQIIAGKTIPFAFLGFLEMGAAMTFGVLWFKVPIVGSLPLLALLAGVFILTTLGLGIFISTLVNTQQQALFLSWFFMVSFILMSGFFYPIENMPKWAQVITTVNPLRYFIEILRELFLKGAGLYVLWPEVLCLLSIGVVIFTLATLRFQKRIA